MRTFFALDLPDKVKLAIADWRDKMYTLDARIVPAPNFHITLHFIGETSPQQLEKLLTAEMQPSPMTIHCTEVGYFAKPKVGFLLVNHNEAITSAATLCRHVVYECGMAVTKGKFTPHITLFRKLKFPLPAPLLPPAFGFSVSSISLFESVSTANGVKYVPLRTWQ
jgi:RNA 2',3'-cyclic 3'-phosphodiesterase